MQRDILIEKALTTMKLSCLDASLADCNILWNFENLYTRFNTLYYVLDGYCKVATKETEYIVSPGEIILIPKNTLVSRSLAKGTSLCKYWCEFEATIGGVNMFDIIKTKQHVKLKEPEKMEELFYQMIFKNPYKTVESRRLYIHAHLTMILSLYIEEGYIKWKNITTSNIDFEPVIRYMTGHLSEKITNEKLASMVHVNPNYFVEAFKKQYGYPPIKFFNELRKEEAVRLLNESNMSVSEIAKAIGIDDVSYFSKMFKNRLGGFTKISPSEQRKGTNKI